MLTFDKRSYGPFNGCADDDYPAPPADLFFITFVDDAAGRAAPDHLAATSTPVLVLGGSRDWNVLPEQVEAWQPVLDADARLEILPGITHALTRLDEEDPAAITPADVGTQVEPVVVDTIAEWLDATLRATPSD